MKLEQYQRIKFLTHIRPLFIKNKCEIFLISQRVNQRYHFTFEMEKLRIRGLSMVLTITKITSRN